MNSIESINFEIMSREQIINLSVIREPNQNSNQINLLNLTSINCKNYLFEIEPENLEIRTEHEIYCSICMDELNSPDYTLCKLSCNHIYHMNCVKKWLEIKFSCPCCRKIPQKSNLILTSRLFATNQMLEQMNIKKNIGHNRMNCIREHIKFVQNF